MHSSASICPSPLENWHKESKGKCPEKLQRPIISAFALFLATTIFLILSSGITVVSANVNLTSHQHPSTGPDQLLPQHNANPQHAVANSPHPENGKNSRFASSSGPVNAHFEDQREEKNFFRDYLSRGMFGCATNYFGILQKLNKLIVSAHQEYSQCQSQIAVSASQSAEESRKLAAQLEMINELFSDE